MIRLMRVLLSTLAVLNLMACAVVDRTPETTFDSGAKWVLLPILNRTETPQAGLRAEAITEAVLRTRGIVSLTRYPAALNAETLFEPTERKVLEQALTWARSEQARYAVTGEVDEWRYKVGIDGEPAVGVTLQIIDLKDGRVAYSGSGGRSGWSREALSAVAQKLIKDILSGARLAR